MSTTFPWRIFERGSQSHCMVVLNTPINFDEALAPRLVEIWNGALVRIAVDGGTNRWLEWLGRTKTTAARPPDLITGDMDSIRPEILQRFRSRPDDRTKVVVTLDQSETDFTKALVQLALHAKERAVDVAHVLVLCDMSGRFDQTISNINTLHKARTLLSGARVYLLSATSLTWLLEPGVEHKIRVPGVLREAQKCCGLLPIGGPCRVRTSGLKWNLDDDVLEFGNLVSSSNTYDDTSEYVTIVSDSHLTWTMEIDAYLRDEFCCNYSNKL